MNGPEPKPYLDPMPFLRRHRGCLTVCLILLTAYCVVRVFEDTLLYSRWSYSFTCLWEAEVPPGLGYVEWRTAEWSDDALGRHQVAEAPTWPSESRVA